MTATSACRIELEALRERLSAIIHELKSAERMIEAFDVPTPAAPPIIPMNVMVDEIVHGRTLLARPARPAKSPAKAAKAAPTKPNGKVKGQTAPKGIRARADGNAGLVIIGALGASREPLSPKALVKLTKLPRWRVMRTLLDMHAAGQLTKVGTRRGAKYALPSTPRSGVGAGTQAAPPAGLPPANGTKSGAHGNDFEVAWNGTKERNGQAPSILPPRERRA